MAELFIYLIMRTPYSLNYKIDSEPDDGMQWTNSTIISTSYPSYLSGTFHLYSSEFNQ